MSVNDALDEHQRQMVAQFIAGQMARVMDAAAPRSESRGAPGGEHGGRKGGKGGMGGAGVSMGSGGAGMTLPGN
ncbi:hypothetical protein D3C86_2072060 [compost metagenome]